MMGALTLESLGTMSDLVLHVRVDGQQAVELDGSQGFVTRNRAGVLRAFKSAGAPLAEVTIPQPGGTIDREDMIQAHMSGNLAPLNVGDEYVVFLRRQESGQLVLAHLEESVFLIRNGRVYPAGQGPGRRRMERAIRRAFLRRPACQSPLGYSQPERRNPANSSAQAASIAASAMKYPYSHSSSGIPRKFIP